MLRKDLPRDRLDRRAEGAGRDGQIGTGDTLRHAKLKKLRCAPNDPDKPPVADMPEFGGEWNMGLSAFYPSSGQEGFYEIDLAFQGTREASDRRL